MPKKACCSLVKHVGSIMNDIFQACLANVVQIKVRITCVLVSLIWWHGSVDQRSLILAVCWQLHLSVLTALYTALVSFVYLMFKTSE